MEGVIPPPPPSTQGMHSAKTTVMAGVQHQMQPCKFTESINMEHLLGGIGHIFWGRVSSSERRGDTLPDNLPPNLVLAIWVPQGGGGRGCPHVGVSTFAGGSLWSGVLYHDFFGWSALWGSPAKGSGFIASVWVGPRYNREYAAAIHIFFGCGPNTAGQST